jgi:type I restriction enzyme R subunit
MVHWQGQTYGKVKWFERMSLSEANPPSSHNFAFLQKQWPDLAGLACFAESYVYTDPASCLVKLRIFAEKMVDVLYYELGLERPDGAANFRDLLQGDRFRQSIPKQIISFLHLIRKEGNKGAHENATALQANERLRLLANVHLVSVWFYGTVTKTKPQVAAFQAPPKPLSPKSLLGRVHTNVFVQECCHEKHYRSAV